LIQPGLELPINPTWGEHVNLYECKQYNIMDSYAESQWISVKYSEFIFNCIIFLYTQLTMYGHIVTRQVPHQEQELLILPELLSSPQFLVDFIFLDLYSFLCNVLWIIVCPFVLFLLAIVMSVLRFTASNYPFWVSSNIS
jgi:hypothetical protein